MKKVFEGVMGHDVPQGWDDAWDAMRNDASVMVKLPEGNPSSQTEGSGEHTGGHTGEHTGGHTGEHAGGHTGELTRERFREPTQRQSRDCIDERTAEQPLNPWMKADVLRGLAGSGDRGVTFVQHDAYQCCEYPLRLNILTFHRWKLSLPFHIIGLPASISGSGYRGDLGALIRDYRRRKGLFLILNLDRTDGIPPDVVSGHTLPTCIFDNSFATFDQYLDALRSPYRRRVRAALAKGKDLEVRAVPGSEFTPEMYQLYRAVHSRSDYPLETLDIGFFQRFDASIHALYHGDAPLAFVMTRRFGDRLYFLFGGMDYAQRDRFDLYYNMLLTIVRIGIDTRVASIDFGQTAEGVKSRIGCHIQPKYLCAFSSNRLIHGLFRIFRASLEYTAHPEDCRSRKDAPARGTTSP